jgi:acetylornithine deacetylase
MKGGLAAVVAAMTAVLASGLANEHPMTLACLVDEDEAPDLPEHQIPEE